MTASNTLEQRIRRLEDREEIGELIARYGFTIDDRDLEAITDLFTEDVVVRSHDGVMNSAGRDAVMEMFHGRFSVLGPSNHFTHDRVITFDADDPDRAFGLVNSHAEMSRSGQPRQASIRYDDEYRRCSDGRWRFRVRALSFFYFTAPSELGATLVETLRVKAYEEPTAAGYPEPLATWQRYYEEYPRPVSP